MTNPCDDYLETAKANLGIARKLRDSKDDVYCGWIIVILFYSAVHSVNALIRFNGEKIPNIHRDRIDKNGKIIEEGRETLAKRYLGKHNYDSWYRKLENYSHHERYDPQPQRGNSVSSDCFILANQIFKYTQSKIQQK
jgi:hypothetical protein